MGRFLWRAEASDGVLATALREASDQQELWPPVAQGLIRDLGTSSPRSARSAANGASV